MADYKCTFSYVRAKDSLPITATGIEHSWKDLKLQFSRKGEGLPGATYYKRISEQGPELFAVKFDPTVWYHDEGKWHRYQTATDVKYDQICSENLNSMRLTPVLIKDDDDEPRFGEQDGTGS